MRRREVSWDFCQEWEIMRGGSQVVCNACFLWSLLRAVFSQPCEWKIPLFKGCRKYVTMELGWKKKQGWRYLKIFSFNERKKRCFWKIYKKTVLIFSFRNLSPRMEKASVVQRLSGNKKWSWDGKINEDGGISKCSPAMRWKSCFWKIHNKNQFWYFL